MRKRKAHGPAPMPQCLQRQGGCPGAEEDGTRPTMLKAPLQKRPPCPGRAKTQPAGLPAHGLPSAELSPRALAISLKEGRSLGLGAQQRCISR